MFWTRLWRRLRSLIAPLPQIGSPLWLHTVQHYPFLNALALHEQAKLRTLSALFLQHKQFYGGHGLVVTDAMAVAIAAQACLPLLHWGEPRQALGWYSDFVGIVVHPGAVLARRQVTDEAGVVHQYAEALVGEAMERGPVMLSWHEVQGGGHSSAHGSNVVVHEFAHKLDMRSGTADGCPPLPAGFMGSRSARAAHALWWSAWEPAYQDFKHRVAMAQRFGAAAPWLDAYGATAPAEFFAVVCEAYFVQRAQCAQELPTLVPLLDAFFQRPAVSMEAHPPLRSAL